MLPVLLTAGDTGFDGKWAIDKKLPKPPGAPEDLQVELKQDGPKLTVKSSYKEPKNAVYPLLWVGIMTYQLDLTADGTEVVNYIGPFALNSKTVIDGNKMTTDFVAASDMAGKVEGQWIRTLSDDGRQMTMQVLASASDGRKLDQTLVFRRK